MSTCLRISAGTLTVDLVQQWINSGKQRYLKKLKNFVWLIFRGRINSRNLLRRKIFSIEGDDYSCVLCTSGLEELTYHLIFQYPVAERCWNLLNIHWDHHLPFFDTIQKTKSYLGYFMETFATAAREIWKINNKSLLVLSKLM
jgi:hypothetical protein